MRKIVLALALFLSVSAPAFAQEMPPETTLEDATEYLDAAFNAIDNRADWNTGVINLRRAIAANPNECVDGRFEDYLSLTEEALALRNEGASEQATYQWWSVRMAELDDDCWE